ncbi:hypothetical protein [Moorena producens]|uniref:hypothetical protein n=1 Tax=Moorena producens TaxID=1155739 RepID=UPI000AB0E732|nr:hypothetical protein [Moorena producens]
MGRWGDGEMGRWAVRWFDNIPSCLLPLASCLLPLASCLPLLGGVRGGSSMPLASCPHNSHTPPVP